MSQELSREEELVDLKQRKIDNLTETLTKLNSKNHKKQKQIIQLVQQLGVEQNQSKNLIKLINKLEKKVRKLEKSKSNKKHNCQRINGLDEKLKDLTNENTVLVNDKNALQVENNSLKGQLTYYQSQDNDLRDTILGLQNQINNHACPIVQQINCSHSDYANLQSQLVEKERIIQEQAQRIKELENKPPLIQTKTQEVEKEIIKEVEIKEDLAKIIEVNLNSLEKELGINLSAKTKEQIKKVVNYQGLDLLRNREIKNWLAQNQTGIITSQNKEVVQPFKNERLTWISLLVASLGVIGGLLMRMRKKRVK